MRLNAFRLSLIALAIQASPAFAAYYAVEDLGSSDDVELLYGVGFQSDVAVANGRYRYTDSFDYDADSELTYQDASALVLRDGVATMISGFDTLTTNGLRTGTTQEFLGGVSPTGLIVGAGSAPTSIYTYTYDGDELTPEVRDFSMRAFAVAGDTVVPVLPPYADTGGQSRISAVNSSNLAVGYASTAMVASSATTYDTCLDNGIPEIVCNQSVVYQIRAYAWQLDDAGNTLDSHSLGLTFEPADDDDSQYLSQAYAINDQGIAVGYSQHAVGGDADNVRNLAAIFTADGASLIHGETAYSQSTAFAISNENSDGVSYVVGQVPMTVDGYSYNKFFIYPYGASDARLKAADDSDSGISDFFRASNSSARAVNSKGQVVGWAEWELVPQSLNRRVHGFLYDDATGTFTDLNSLIACDSPYEIVSASAINEDGEILADALVEVDERDQAGSVVADSKEYVVRTVKLTLTGEASGNCPNPELPTVSRKGGVLPVSGLLMLASLLFGRWLFRRTKG